MKIPSPKPDKLRCTDWRLKFLTVSNRDFTDAWCQKQMSSTAIRKCASPPARQGKHLLVFALIWHELPALVNENRSLLERPMTCTARPAGLYFCSPPVPGRTLPWLPATTAMHQCLWRKRFNSHGRLAPCRYHTRVTTETKSDAGAEKSQTKIWLLQNRKNI